MPLIIVKNPRAILPRQKLISALKPKRAVMPVI
jgi:hypothetical protein